LDVSSLPEKDGITRVAWQDAFSIESVPALIEHTINAAFSLTADCNTTSEKFSLSRWERAGVRGIGSPPAL
jgi:hypothetical protein